MQDRDKARSPVHSDISAAAAPTARLKPSEHAFTRIELFVVGAALLLIALVVAPALAGNKSDSERLICFNNLRLIGRAVQTWAGDHNLQLPSRTPYTDGGTLPPAGQFRPGAAWVEFTFLSNDLATPKILVCPSDAGGIRATGWIAFTSSGYRSKAVSYSVSLDGSMDAPRTWLSADRNFRAHGPGSFACSSGVTPTEQILSFDSNPPLAWTNAVHGTFGHVMTMDGSVEFTSTQRLRELLLRPDVADDGVTHFLRAR